MAKFDDLYPRSPYLFTVEFEGSFLSKGDDTDEPYECIACGHLTHWLDGFFNAPLCSEECERIAWSDYIKELADRA